MSEPLAQLEYELLAPIDQMPAETPFDAGKRVLELVDKLAAGHQTGRRVRHVNWVLDYQGPGTARFRSGSSPDLARTAALDVVRGFGEAERVAALPSAWSVAAAIPARKLAEMLGETEDTGLALKADVQGVSPITTVVTRAAAKHLVDATKLRFTSYGSVVGKLGGASVFPRRRAGLWSDTDRRRVEVRFQPEHDEAVREAWGAEHVEIAGVLHENSAGQVLRIDLCEIVRVDSGGPTFTEVGAGFYPGITGGLSTEEFLAVARGED